MTGAGVRTCGAIIVAVVLLFRSANDPTSRACSCSQNLASSSATSITAFYSGAGHQHNRASPLMGSLAHARNLERVQITPTNPPGHTVAGPRTRARRTGRVSVMPSPLTNYTHETWLPLRGTLEASTTGVAEVIGSPVPDGVSRR